MSGPSIFIRCRRTQKLFRTKRTWTREPTKARSFESALTAFNFAGDANLRDVEIVWLRPEAETVQPIFEAHRGDVRIAVNMA